MAKKNQTVKLNNGARGEYDQRREELLYMGWYVALLDLKKKNAAQFIVNNTCL